MNRVIGWLLVISALGILAACEPTVEVPTATQPPTSTAVPSATPTRVPQALPTAFFGREIEASRNTATIRIIHAAEGGAALDVFLEDAQLVGSLGYSLASGLITSIPGTYTLSAQARGSDTVLAETSVTLTAGVTTDVVITPGAEGIQMLVLNGPERALDAGLSAARVVNALPDAGDVSVRLNSTSTGAPIGTGAATDLLTFAEGDLSTEFVSGETTLYSDSTRLRALTNMVLVLTGTSARPMLLVFESPTLSLYSLRVVNMSRDAREIDVLFDDALVAGNLAYQGATERTVYSTASATLRVFAANADVANSIPFLAGERISPKPGTSVTLAIYGPVDSMRAMWIEEDNTPVPAGQARVTFAHMLTGVQSLRVGVNSQDLPEIRSFGYGEVSQPVLFDEGVVRVFLRDASREGAIVELRDALPITAGESVLYFVVGTDDDDTPPTLVEKVDVDEALAAQPLETPSGLFRVRYVNAIASQPSIDIFQDGTKIVSGLRYASVSPLQDLSSSSFQFVAALNDSVATLVDQRYSLTDPGDYTVFIFGTPEEGIGALYLADSRLQSSAGVGTARLVNLTQDPAAQYGLALVPITVPVVGQTTVPTVVPTATAEGGPSVELGRQRLPSGAAVPIRDVGPGKASRTTGVTANALVYVITLDQEIVASLPSVAFAANTHTDVVVYEYRTATETSAIVFPLIYLPP